MKKIKKHRRIKIVLIALVVLLVTAASGAWSMFGTQLTAARTKLLPNSAKRTFNIDKENDEQDAEIGSSLKLPILDEINQNTVVGTTGSFMTAVQSAVKLLDWGVNTGLDPEEIKGAIVSWLVNKGNDEQVEFAEKLALVDEAYQKLLRDDAQELLVSAGCEDAAYPWSYAPVESIEAIMEAAGLRQEKLN